VSKFNFVMVDGRGDPNTAQSYQDALEALDAVAFSLCYNSGVGTLYLVATPIGNLEDITQRALRILREVDLIAAEDTRQTRKLLRHYQIPTKMLSYHEHNKLVRQEQLLRALDQGDVALVSDAGTPGLSDPGYLLIQAALDSEHDVSSIPGPSAPVAALVASGLPTDSFVFVGYLPRRASKRQRALSALAEERRTLLIFEAPHRLLATLAEMSEIFGGGRRVAVCRELTKVHEQILRTTIEEARVHFTSVPPRGEFTLAIAGSPSEHVWHEDAVREALSEHLAAGLSPSEAARKVAVESGWSRRDVYRLTLEDS
jgi:16S rRNA (cytidine1402-2'-O)-methyltransferase